MLGAKDERDVEVPLVWTPSDSAAPPYYLRGAIIHHGLSVAGGHYTCIRIVNHLDGRAVLVISYIDRSLSFE